jgi:carbonic anhydrase
MNRIIQGIQEFQKNVFPAKRGLFQHLASGQNPEALFITCSDSRISLEWLTQSAPGDLFVARNAGNMAPSYGHADAVSATIEYAVSALRIRHIVVCGHSDCGAMKGLLHPEAVSEMPNVKRWLRNGEGARRALDDARVSVHAPDALSILTKLNIRLQLDHLRTHPHVISRIWSGSLELHGWFYEIGTGEVLAWDSLSHRWIPVQNAAELANAFPEAQHA